MKDKSELESIKNYVDSMYSHFGNMLLVNTDKPYDPQHSELGYCYKYTDPVTKNVVYRIICSNIGIPRTDFRVMMHEYGHIYLSHLDGIHEELDTNICNVFRDHRGELIDRINESCGIDFADKLIERVIDDPILNHSLHNIAMDMEVNSSVLSTEDVEEMEMDITSILPKYEEELLKYMIDHEVSEEKKKALQDALKKMEKEAKIKLILPCRYYLVQDEDDPSKSIPFPDGLTYAEYLILIIEHLDQFVKMLVSIQMGGNGDTSQISQRDIQNALNNMKRDWANKSEEYKRGYNDALKDYQNGQLNKNKQQNQGNPQNSNQQGDGDGQESQDPNNAAGAGMGNPSESGSPSNSGSMPNSGESGSGQSDYEQGYNDALQDIANNQGKGGQGGGMQGLSDLLNDMGMSDNGDSDSSDSNQNSQSGHKYTGKRRDYNEEDDGKAGGVKDHRTQSRDDADKKRELGQIKAGGGVGCGDSGGPDATRIVDKEADLVEMALREVIRNMRSKVIKQDTKKDIMKLYNRGVVRSVIAPTVSRKVTISNEIKIAYLIDISGSMDTALVDRILNTIAISMKKLSRGLRYDIITWSTCLGEHIKDIDPRKSVPRISYGGGTSIAAGIKYFKEHYGPETILVVISDFEDYLEEWNEVEKTMPNYTLYGFDYGDGSYRNSDDIPWKYMKVRKFNKRHK